MTSINCRAVSSANIKLKYDWTSSTHVLQSKYLEMIIIISFINDKNVFLLHFRKSAFCIHRIAILKTGFITEDDFCQSSPPCLNSNRTFGGIRHMRTSMFNQKFLFKGDLTWRSPIFKEDA